MKKFTTSALLSLSVLAISSAAFAGTTTNAARGMAGVAVNDTVVPADTVVPEQKESTPEQTFTQLADTVVPTDTVAPEQKQEPAFTLADTVVPADTVTPQQEEPAKQESEPAE